MIILLALLAIFFGVHLINNQLVSIGLSERQMWNMWIGVALILVAQALVS